MKIECFGTVGIVNTKKVSYIKKRKGYYVGKRYVKPKKIVKFKEVPIKEPYLFGYIYLDVDQTLFVGKQYIDENGKKYLCVSTHNFTTPLSHLKIISPNLFKTFAAPKTLNLCT